MLLSQTRFLRETEGSLNAVLPIIGIVLLLSFYHCLYYSGILLSFILGAVLLIIGMIFFTSGARNRYDRADG